jgi:hypothetical protein
MNIVEFFLTLADHLNQYIQRFGAKVKNSTSTTSFRDF